MVLQADTVYKKMELRKNLLLQEIFQNGPIGRSELGRNLRMSKSRLCEVVLEMIDVGLITEDLEGTERRGRRPVPLSTNPDYGCFIGLDFEAKRMRVVVVDFSGQVLFQKQQKLKAIKRRNSLINKLLAFIDEGTKAAKKSKAKILGIGIAAPGTIHRKTGTLVHHDLIEAAHNIPLRQLVEAHTGLPCVVENNIRCYALREWSSGAAKNMSNFVFIAVRSGFGLAIIADGKALNGSHGLSGEAGSAPAPSNAPVSQWKTLNDLVSEKALNVESEENAIDIPRAKAKPAGEILGAMTATLATLLDPQAIVLAGALLKPEGPLWNTVNQTYNRFMLADVKDGVQLIPSEVGPFAAAIGATQRCFQELYSTRLNLETQSFRN